MSRGLSFVSLLGRERRTTREERQRRRALTLSRSPSFFCSARQTKNGNKNTKCRQNLAGREVCVYSISCKNQTNIDLTLKWLTKHAKT